MYAICVWPNRHQMPKIRICVVRLRIETFSPKRRRVARCIFWKLLACRLFQNGATENAATATTKMAAETRLEAKNACEPTTIITNIHEGWRTCRRTTDSPCTFSCARNVETKYYVFIIFHICHDATQPAYTFHSNRLITIIITLAILHWCVCVCDCCTHRMLDGVTVWRVCNEKHGSQFTDARSPAGQQNCALCVFFGRVVWGIRIEYSAVHRFVHL